MGRFLSPDPTLRSGHPADPQTWNRYVYGGNNPLKFIDPDGKEKQLVIYVQQPVPNTRTVSTTAGTNYGHAFIGLKDTVSGVEHRIGFYPKAQQQNNGALAGEASNAQGSQHWDVANKTAIAAGKDKCNEFVGDMIEGVGRARPKVKYTGWRGWLGFTRDPSAKEWATIPIPGYSAPMPISSASKGDIIAVGHTGDAQGHVGIYVGGSGVASANWYQGGAITINNWGFRPAGQNDEEGGTVVVRKWLGDQ